MLSFPKRITVFHIHPLGQLSKFNLHNILQILLIFRFLWLDLTSLSSVFEISCSTLMFFMRIHNYVRCKKWRYELSGCTSVIYALFYQFPHLFTCVIVINKFWFKTVGRMHCALFWIGCCLYFSLPALLLSLRMALMFIVRGEMARNYIGKEQ